MLTSDSKSNIEGLRWVLIRRSAIGIIFMVIFTLGTIRYATFMAHKRQKEADQQAREEQELKKHDGRADITPAPDAAEILAAN
jgi:cbb3-type cytochrome oxidase subunit 3